MAMRYATEHKEESRGRILEAAAKQFRAAGTEAVRVSDVMRAAGMTHGGFYKHFENKDQLLQEAIAIALAEVSEQIAAMTRDMSREQALKKVIEFYLSEDHLQHPDLGCALAALGTEMARMPRLMKIEISKALDAYADRLDYLMPGKTKAQQRAAFLVLFPSMAGCIMAARAYASKERRQQILAGGAAFFTHAFCGHASSGFEESSQ